MKNALRWLGIVGAAALGSVTFATAATPGVGNAVECGAGTVFDAPSNSCVAAPAPPPPPPPPPAWNGDLTPGFSVGVCVPIPLPFFSPSICGSV